MKTYKSFFIFLFITTIISCKKNVTDKVNTISGRLLESSSNPIPVNSYKLTLNQNQVLSPFGSYSGIEQTVTTDNDGKFSFSYSLKTGSGVGTGSTNTNVLYISSNDTLKYKNLYPEFNPISVTIALYVEAQIVAKLLATRHQIPFGKVSFQVRTFQ